MRIYKDRVLEDRLGSVDLSLIKERWENFKKYQSRKDEIKKFKEEKYQDGFLTDIFENCLGYQKDTTKAENHNLRREEKDERGLKKADSVIVFRDRVIGIIELKDTKTKNLDQIEAQAFGYHNSHNHSKYIITSNFEKLRFYIDKRVAFEEFELFKMSFEEFKKLHLIISFESIKENLPIELQGSSRKYEKDISDQLYREFSDIRVELFKNIIENNEIDKPLALSLSQKILDRSIFVLFAEDKNLINPKITDQIVENWKTDWEDRNLYHFVKLLFKAIDIGNSRMEIPPYNGGLFKLDNSIENLTVDNSILEKILKLSKYDFKSEIDVNILGHIFENSLDELQKIQEDLLGDNFDIDKSIRKRDGIFYTPKYITEYIVNSTLGKMCETKKSELNLSENSTIEEFFEYQKFLQNLKILDPACGSGAFLNGAFDYLYREYKFVDEVVSKERFEKGDLFINADLDTQILENNLFGVDINSEAVTIAKLSLWLKTAKKGRKLTDLSKNIVVANSLTDMPFKKESFDIVVGNPPYGAKLEKEKKEFPIQSNESAILFMQLSKNMLKKGGYHSFIIPKPFIYSSTWKKIRELFFENITEIVDCGKVWKEVKLEQVIYSTINGENRSSYKNLVLKDGKFNVVATIDKKLYSDFEFFVNGVSESEIDLALKSKKSMVSLFEISQSNWGDTFFKEVKETSDKYKVLGGANIQKYIIQGVKGFVGKDLEKISNNAYIRENSVLVQRIIAHITKPKEHIKITGVVTEQQQYTLILNTVQQISLNPDYSNRYILALLHSKFINWFVYRFIFAKAIRTFQFSNDVLKKIPIPQISETQQKPFIELVEKIISAKEKILKAEKHIDKLSAIDKIDVLDEVENLKTQISKTEKEIDQRVYKLYNLTESEIKLIESS